MKTHNNYLYIRETKDSKLDISSNDGVFNSIVTKSKEDFVTYCKEKAEDFSYSELLNYGHLSTEQREELAKRWENASCLKVGRYDYYFNLESKEKLFKQAIAEMAKNLGIKYNLIIK